LLLSTALWPVFAQISNYFEAFFAFSTGFPLENLRKNGRIDAHWVALTFLDLI
jgi:hypothetical protein